jgi:predicted phage terminase large subunit-like protein
MEGNILKRDWFGRFDSDKIAGQTVNFYVDTAYSSDSSADYSVILAYVKKDNCYYIVNISRKKLDFPDFINELKSQVQMYGSARSIVKVEPKATGKTVVQSLRNSSQLNISESKAPTTDKESRLMAISPIIESRRVYLLNNAHWVDNFLEEVCQFPNSKNDDQADCMIMMLEENINQANYRLML